MALTEVRLRPTGPWRVGHHAGDKERVDVIYRSDALFSAMTHAMRVLGWMDEWLDATARAQGAPAVRLSSLFPFIGKTRLITPPKSAWPPANSGKLYLQGIRLAPLDVAKGGPVDESRWTADGASECLIPSGAASPFQVSVRTSAAVDRLTGVAEPHRVACLEFAANAGWWGVYDAVDSIWDQRVRAAFRWLADSGFGGERSRGWGRAAEPQFSTASSLFPNGSSDGSWWLLSLYSPHEGDGVDWSKGSYSAVVRGGWTDSPAGSGQKKSVRMIEEGSVLVGSGLRGQAVDVAPDGFGHPVYRSGLGLAVALGPTPPHVGHVSDLPEAPAPEEPGQTEPPVQPEDVAPVPDRQQEQAREDLEQVSGLTEAAAPEEPEQAKSPVLPEDVAPVPDRQQEEVREDPGQVSDLREGPAPEDPGQAEPPVLPEDVAPVPGRQQEEAWEDPGQVSNLREAPAPEEPGHAEPPVLPEDEAPVPDRQQDEAREDLAQVSDLPEAHAPEERKQTKSPTPPEEPES